MGPYLVILEDCNNLGMVRLGNKPHCPLSTTHTHADVLWVLKQYIVRQPFALKFLYVASHANNTKSWKDCPLIKESTSNLTSLPRRCYNVLRSWTSFLIDDSHMKISKFTIKVTGQVKPALKEYWGRATTKTFLGQKNIVPLNEFANVWWSGISKVNASYPKMF
jgi:hypothetical protein